MERRAKPVRVLIAGGGVAALEATLALRALADERVAITLVAPESDFVYRPLAVAEPFRVGEVRRFPLRPLVHAAGGELRQGRVTAVDPERRVVVTEEQEELRYEVLLLALGAVAREALAGPLTFRGPEDGPALAALLERGVEGQLRSLAFALPAGVTWPLPLYELALLTWTYFTERGTMGVELTLVTPEEAPLGLFGARASEAIRELLETRGIALHLRATPVSFEEGVLRLAPDRQGSPLSPLPGRNGRVGRRYGGALVAAREDRRPLPGALPRGGAGTAGDAAEGGRRGCLGRSRAQPARARVDAAPLKNA